MDILPTLPGLRSSVSSQPINTVFLRALCFVFKLLEWHSSIYWWLFNFVSFWTDEGLTVRQAGGLGQKQGQGSPPSCRSLIHTGDKERKSRSTSDPGTEIKLLHQQWTSVQMSPFSHLHFQCGLLPRYHSYSSKQRWPAGWNQPQHPLPAVCCGTVCVLPVDLWAEHSSALR